MKKVLVLMLVLGLTSIAVAQNTDKLIQLSVNGEVVDEYPAGGYLQISDTVTIDIMLAPDIAMDSMDLTLTVEGPGSIGDVTTANIVAPFESWSKMIVGAGPKGVDNIVGVSFILDPPFGVTGTLVDLIEFHCDGRGDVVISLAPAPGGANNLIPGGIADVDMMGSIVIHQIPEPMTITLLGLGGLALLRRRK